MSRRSAVPIEKVISLANDRARLIQALRVSFRSLGIPEEQVDKIITEVRACNFSTLNKTFKIK